MSVCVCVWPNAIAHLRLASDVLGDVFFCVARIYFPHFEHDRGRKTIRRDPLLQSTVEQSGPLSSRHRNGAVEFLVEFKRARQSKTVCKCTHQTAEAITYTHTCESALVRTVCFTFCCCQQCERRQRSLEYLVGSLN